MKILESIPARVQTVSPQSTIRGSHVERSKRLAPDISVASLALRVSRSGSGAGGVQCTTSIRVEGLDPRELNIDSSVEFSVPDHDAVHSPSVPVELPLDRFTLGTQSILPPKQRELHPKEDVPLMSTPYVGIRSNSSKEATCTTQFLY